MEKEYNKEKAYDVALGLISKDIREHSDYAITDIGGGRKGFKIAIADTSLKHEDYKSNVQEIANQIVANPDNIHSISIVSNNDIRRISAKANKGFNPRIPPNAMAVQSISKGNITAIDTLNAQIERLRKLDIEKNGSTDLQPLPKRYIETFKNEVERIPAGLRHLLNDELTPVSTNKAYTSAGYQPPNQEHYYNKTIPLVSVGDPNAIAGDDLVIKNSSETLGYNITDATIREVLQLMEGGRFSSAGEGQWDAERLLKAAEYANLPLEELFDTETQTTLLRATIKNEGVNGFPHKQMEDNNVAIVEEVKENLNTDKLPENYWRSMSACNEFACNWLLTEGAY